MFFATISAEILRICQATFSAVQFMKTSQAFLHRMMRKGPDRLGVKKVLVKMITLREEILAIKNCCRINYCRCYFCNFGQ